MANKKYKTKWEKGDRSKIARRLGVAASVVCDYVNGHRNVTPSTAVKLEKLCAELGYNIPRSAWVFHDERDPRLFPSSDRPGKKGRR